MSNKMFAQPVRTTVSTNIRLARGISVGIALGLGVAVVLMYVMRLLAL